MSSTTTTTSTKIGTIETIEVQKANRHREADEKRILVGLLLLAFVVIAAMNGIHGNSSKAQVSTVVSAKSPYAYYLPWDLRKKKYLDLQPTIPATEAATDTYYDSSIEERGYKNNDEPFECCCYLQQQRNKLINTTSPSNPANLITVEEEGPWLPLKKVFCVSSYDESIEYEYTIDLAKLQRMCTGKGCHHRLWLTSTSARGGAITIDLNGSSFIGCGGREYASFCILLAVCLLLSFDYISRSQVLILGVVVSLTLLAVVGRFPTAEKIMGWLNATTVFFVVVMELVVGMLKDINFFPWLAATIVRSTSSDPIRVSVCLWIGTGVFSAVFPTLPLSMFASELTLEVCEILQMPSIYPVMGVLFMANIGGSILKYGSFLTISMCDDFGISFGQYFTEVTLCTFVSTVAVFFVIFLKFGLKIKDYPIKKILWLQESAKKDSDSDSDFSSSGSESSDTDSSDDDEYEIGMLPNGTPIRRSASGSSHRRKDGRIRLHRKLYLEDYRLKNPGFAMTCGVMSAVFFVLFLLHEVIGLDSGLCALLVMFLLLMLSSPFSPPEALKKMNTSLVVLTMLFLVFIGSLDELGLNNLTCK